MAGPVPSSRWRRKGTYVREALLEVCELLRDGKAGTGEFKQIWLNICSIRSPQKESQSSPAHLRAKQGDYVWSPSWRNVVLLLSSKIGCHSMALEASAQLDSEMIWCKELAI